MMSLPSPADRRDGSGGYAAGRRSRPQELDPVKLQHLDGVAAQDLVGGLLVKAGAQLLDVGLGVRPRRVGVRVVGLEADVVLADLLE